MQQTPPPLTSDLFKEIRVPRPYRTNLIYPGAVFGRLTVIEKLLPHVFPSGGTAPRWSCRCECGNVVVVLNVSLLSKNTASCGCFMRENNGRLMAIRKTTHGEANRTPEYEAWSKSKDRCHNPKSKNWSNYGRRGIVMSERWRNSYETFLADVGRRPSSKHSFDRYPDNDGNYEPGNVRWATKQEQARNRKDQQALRIQRRNADLMGVGSSHWGSFGNDQRSNPKGMERRTRLNHPLRT